MVKLTITLLFFAFSTSLEAREKEPNTSNKSNTTIDCHVGQSKGCKHASKEKIRKNTEQDVEVIHIKGQFIGLQAPEIEGRFHLNKQFIEAVPTANGNINEVIQHLPGVQISDTAFDVDQLAEIRPQQIAISGAEPWQTGFIVDGMNFNSGIDPSAHNRSENAINDVQGQTESMNLTTELVQSIDVYDSNVPARFGDFSGGVVDVQSVSPFEQQDNSYRFGLNGTSTDWVQYHIVDNTNNRNPSTWPEEPQFEKLTSHGSATIAMTDQQKLQLTARHLKSTISQLSLGQIVPSKKQNTNMLIRYSSRDTWVDSIDWSIIHAPYSSRTQRINVLDSDYTINGGATSSVLNIRHAGDWADWKHHLSINHSQNSRKAPSNFYPWLQLRGKGWGISGDDNGFSNQGGYGDLEKIQLNITSSSALTLAPLTWGNSEHVMNMGVVINHSEFQRLRPKNTYTYQSPRQFSTLPDQQGLNCSGYVTDCVELETSISMDEFETQLGRPFDPSNFNDLSAYSDIIVTTPQYFTNRLVREQEDITVDMLKYSGYIDDNIQWGAVTLNAGLRYDYDDFFKNHNLAPRLSMGIDLFDNSDHKLILGANRYYAAGLIAYRLRQEQKLSYFEHRARQNGYLQGWIPSAQSNGIRYIYQDIATPYNDELVTGWVYKNAIFGTISIKYVQRWQQQQLANAQDAFIDDVGNRYIYQDNSGSGKARRLSLAWHHNVGNYHWWANTSLNEREVLLSQADLNINNYALEDLVVFQGTVVPRVYITLLNQNFAPPLDLKIGVSTTWKETFFSAIMSLYDKRQRIEQSIKNSRVELNSVCISCDQSSFDIPTFETFEYPTRVNIDIKVKHKWQLTNDHYFNVSLDIRNLFNSRTYRVRNQIGLEAGRQFFVNFEYKIN